MVENNMNKVLTFIKNSRVAQLTIALLVGVAVGALFYPTQHIEETVKQEYQQKIDKVLIEKEQIRKELTDKLDVETKLHTEYKVEMTRTVVTLQSQVKELKASKKETFYKIVKPDGTIEIKKYTESEVSETTKVITEIREEFDKKITEISDKWQKVHKERVEILVKDFEKKETEYKETIAKLEKKLIIDTNPRSTGLEVGYLSNKQYYGHVNMDVFGPMFIGVQTQSNFIDKYAVGIGAGIRF
jgi:hypothetical protein